MEDTIANALEGAAISNSLIETDANKYANDPQIEYQWAIKAAQHAEIHFNLLCAIDPKLLKLTKNDETIYQDFRTFFPDLKVDKIDENELKSQEGKQKWNPFCESYKGGVEDYNMATLLRIDSKLDYDEENTTIVPRIQFYAIEIARNKEGFNEAVRSKFKKVHDKVSQDN